MIPSSRQNAIIRALLLLSLPAPLQAQHSGPQTAPAEAGAGDVTTMDTIQVVAPKPQLETADLYRYRNPVEPGGSRFDKSWNGTMSLEEVGKQGGFVQLGIAYAIGKAGEAVTHTPGWKAQIQNAVARPAPAFTEEQLRRASSSCASGGTSCE